MRHLAKVRLGQAAGYLATADLSVDAIARRTGYASNASLSKAFKREFGVSPGAYRRSGGDAGLLRGGRAGGSRRITGAAPGIAWEAAGS